MPILLFGGFSSPNRLRNSSLNMEASASFFAKCDHYQSFHLCMPPRLEFRSIPQRALLGCTLLPAFNWPPCDKTNTKTLSQVKKASDSWIFYHRGWKVGGGVSRVHPITDSNEVKYSPANRGTRQWNGRVQSCSEAPRYPAKCANQNLVCLINTSGQQIALLGNWWRLEGCIKGQGRGDR